MWGIHFRRPLLGPPNRFWTQFWEIPTEGKGKKHQQKNVKDCASQALPEKPNAGNDSIWSTCGDERTLPRLIDIKWWTSRHVEKSRTIIKSTSVKRKWWRSYICKLTKLLQAASGGVRAIPSSVGITLAMRGDYIGRN